MEKEARELIEAEVMNDDSPMGIKMNYLFGEGTVFASARSWSNALKVPKALRPWFEELGITANLKRDVLGELERTYKKTKVYRWPAVAERLRIFDRNWHNGKYRNDSRFTKIEIDNFHQNYEKLVNWGYSLQERTLFKLVEDPELEKTNLDKLKQTLNQMMDSVSSQGEQVIDLDNRVTKNHIFITEINDKIDQSLFKSFDLEEFITIKKAVIERQLDPNSMPLYPQSCQNFTGLIGELLSNRKCHIGEKEVSRIDGSPKMLELNTYHRGEIYKVIDEVLSKPQLKMDL